MYFRYTTTDVLSEGQNLQDCKNLINYDLSWNPVRIIQREGMIDRVTSPHPMIEICNFMPANEINDLIHIVDKLSQKISYINSVICSESQILSSLEITKDKVFNDDSDEYLDNTDLSFLKQMAKSNDLNSLFDSLEKKIDGMLSSDEYILDEYKSRTFEDKEEFKRVENLPSGIHSIFECNCHKGLYVYFKSNGVDYWLIYDINNNEIYSNKEYIYSVLSQCKYLKSKPIQQNHGFVVENILAKCREHVLNQSKILIGNKMSNSEISKV